MALCSVFIASSSETCPQNPPIAHAPKLISETSQPVRPSARYFIFPIRPPIKYIVLTRSHYLLIFHRKLTTASPPIHRPFLKSCLYQHLNAVCKRSCSHEMAKFIRTGIRDSSNVSRSKLRYCSSQSRSRQWQGSGFSRRSFGWSAG